MKDDEKVVFAVTEDKSTLILGVSETSWNYMKYGDSHTLDLNKLGIPFKIILYGGKTKADVMKPLNITRDTLDVRGIDFGFGGE